MAILTPASDLKKILVSRTDRLGDVILSLPIATALKKALPNTEVAFLVKPYTAPITKRISQIDETFSITSSRKGLHIFKIYKPDAVIFAKPELQLAIEAVMAKIDVRIGTGYRYYSGLFTRWVYEHRQKGTKHESEYSVNLLSPLIDQNFEVEMPSLIVSEIGKIEAENKLKELGIEGKYIVVHPGSFGSSPDYLPEDYAQVCLFLLEKHKDLSIVISAGPNEIGIANRVLVNGLNNNSKIKIVSDLSLDAFSELLRGASLMLGSASGPAHLSALVNTPTVSLFPGLQPMWPARWKPLGKEVSVLVPHADEPLCIDCNCNRKKEPENCIKRIPSFRVFEACDNLLTKHKIIQDHIF
jgi:heptosyltransferase-2